VTDERKTIQDYSPETYERVRQALLHVATVLGDWMERVTLIGGAVPSLLIPQNTLPTQADRDLGLAHPGGGHVRPRRAVRFGGGASCTAAALRATSPTDSPLLVPEIENLWLKSLRPSVLPDARFVRFPLLSEGGVRGGRLLRPASRLALRPGAGCFQHPVDLVADGKHTEINGDDQHEEL
jgi:hypothetical protein